MLVLILIVLL